VTTTPATPTEAERETARRLYVAARDGAGKKAISLIAQALADQRARYETWLTELHLVDDRGYCIECERPAGNGCLTMLELPRIRQVGTA